MTTLNDFIGALEIGNQRIEQNDDLLHAAASSPVPMPTLRAPGPWGRCIGDETVSD
jgi:hypothetical protein